MSEFPGQANVVVIGAGIVGNSMIYHLARLGWKDLVLLDKGPLPNPGGSTGHASNFIFPVDHSKEMTRFTQDSVRQYEELGVFTTSGGIEVARTPARMEELKRRLASAKSWGEPAELISPAEVKRLVPFINEAIILGGFYSPGVGVVVTRNERFGEDGQAQVRASVEVGRMVAAEVSVGDLQNGATAMDQALCRSFAAENRDCRLQRAASDFVVPATYRIDATLVDLRALERVGRQYVHTQSHLGDDWEAFARYRQTGSARYLTLNLLLLGLALVFITRQPDVGTTVLISAEGEMVRVHDGAVTRDKLADMIRADLLDS